MNLDYLGKTIIAAVAQRPFTSATNYGTNTFCKLVPLFDLGEEAENPLEEKDFYNDGEIWWRLSSIHSSHVIPGMLMELRLEHAPGADERASDNSLYQARFERPEGVLTSKSGAEVFPLTDATENSLSNFKGEGSAQVFPHLPSRIIFFQLAGFVYGPFATDIKDVESQSCKVKALVKPFESMTVFKMSARDFYDKYRVLRASKDVSLNQTPRRESNLVEHVSWTYLPMSEYVKVKNDFSAVWQEMDFEPLSMKLSRIVRSVEGFYREDRKQIKFLVERLEQAITRVEDPLKIREAIACVGTLTDTVDKSIRDIATILLENGLLNEEKLEEAKRDYLDKWITSQSEQINQAIEAKQRELDNLSQRVADEKSKFEFEKKRREKELQDKEEKVLADLADIEKEERGRIDAERANWDIERDKLKSEFEDKETKISAMLQNIQGAVETQAAEILRMYPFLKGLQVASGTSDEKQNEKELLDEPIAFSIPTILKKRCRAATVAIDQTMFLRNFESLARSEGFYFDPIDLRRFHTSVLCEGLTVLAGPSGVGKSSLARLYGEALSGGEAEPRNGTHVIHVNPTWMERSDILGYVNTVSGEFSPSETGLFQRLIYATEDYNTNGGESALYPICLDEMNLSQIEHYFNDFMQLLEQPERDRILPCFSPESVKKGSVFRKYAHVSLAPSLRFIGTVNFDETTRHMSMRLLDRVNLIHLSDSVPSRRPGNIRNQEVNYGVTYQTYSSWIRRENLSASTERCLQELDSPFRSLGTMVSPRVREGMKKYIASSRPLIDEANPEQIAFDEQIAQRVLSKIRSLTSTRQEDALGEVEKILSDYCGSTMTQSRCLIDALREQGRPFGFQSEDED